MVSSVKVHCPRTLPPAGRARPLPPAALFRPGKWLHLPSHGPAFRAERPQRPAPQHLVHALSGNNRNGHASSAGDAEVEEGRQGASLVGGGTCTRSWPGAIVGCSVAVVGVDVFIRWPQHPLTFLYPRLTPPHAAVNLDDILGQGEGTPAAAQAGAQASLEDEYEDDDEVIGLDDIIQGHLGDEEGEDTGEEGVGALRDVGWD